MTDSECQNERGTETGAGDAGDPAYPEELREAEKELFERCKSREPGGRPEVGLALSGGGIRSATFSFGVIQALARKKTLERIHVLSTVSGGAYTGSLLAQLFARKAIKCHDGVRKVILSATETKEEESSDNSHDEEAGKSRPASETTGANASDASANSTQIPAGGVLRWLRDNGRYLAPNGGDLLLNGAILLRNWLSVHIALATGVLAIFVLMQVLRGLAHDALPRAHGSVAGACTVDFQSFLSIEGWLTCHLPFGETWLWWSPWVLVPAVPVVIAVVLGCLYWLAVVRRKREECRHWLSLKLAAALMTSGTLLALALIDSLGQTIYAKWSTPGFSWGGELAAVLWTLVGIFAGARRVAAYVSGARSAVRWPSLRILAGFAAVALFTTWLVALNGVAHAIAWQGDYPRQVPEKLVAKPASEAETSRSGHAPDKRLGRFECSEDCAELGKYQPVPTLGIALVLMVVTFVFGKWKSFLNGSTLLPLYTAWLTRAYLGASNPKRYCEETPVAVTQVQEDDDIDLDWGRWTKESCDNDPFAKGAPLHLTSVTINETRGGKVQLEQTGRKGIGMAVGPAGLSAGVRHHVVFKKRRGYRVFPTTGYRMFGGGEGRDERCYRGQCLSLGQWVGISGAAFSTGLGTRTNMPFSLLAGFFNVRLGFWWDSGVDPKTRNKEKKRSGFAARCGRWFTSAFALPMYSYLLDEFFGRFHGPARQYWCLTDGGHFDNTGAYELLRRRLPLIVVVDAEADPDYALDGLGNLVRRARADFSAEIEFVDRAELDSWKESDKEEKRHFLKYVGTLEELRCAKHDERRNASAGASAPAQPKSPGPREDDSRPHAAVAFVRYGATESTGVLVYIKPTLVGTEPADVMHYHAANPDFPHQTTVDQFYDEAQWESYRKLGDLIAQRVIGAEDAISFYRDKAQSPR